MKTTPTLGLKLYDGTDAPDLVSGYNASMSAIDGSGVLAFQGTVQDSTDWDTITDAGYYNCSNTKFSSANHSPVGSYNYGVLIVYNRCYTPEESECATQIYYPHSGGNYVDRNPVSRANYSNAWSAWAPLVYVPNVEGALPANGAAGQVLVKNSDTDHDCEWMDPTALNTMVAYNGNTNCLLANGTEVAALKMRSIEGLELLNNGAPVTQSTGLIAVSPSNTGGSDYSKFVGSTLKAGKGYLGILETQGIVNGYTVFAYGCVVISMTAAAVTVVGTPVYNLIGKAVAVPMQIVCEYGGGTTVLLSEGSTEQFSTINITPIGNI